MRKSKKVFRVASLATLFLFLGVANVSAAILTTHVDNDTFETLDIDNWNYDRVTELEKIILVDGDSNVSFDDYKDSVSSDLVTGDLNVDYSGQQRKEIEEQKEKSITENIVSENSVEISPKAEHSVSAWGIILVVSIALLLVFVAIKIGLKTYRRKK